MSGRHRLLAVALAGGTGGLLNAALCYMGWPVAVQHADFKWHIMPAGFLHGAVLATVAVAAGVIGSRVQVTSRWAIAVVAGWLAGYGSWIPLHMSLSTESPLRAFMWPLLDSGLPDALWTPFAYFGGVAFLTCAWTAYCLFQKSLGRSILATGLAGVVGSLWFWIEYEYWYFSCLHGLVWGSLVGTVLWRYSMAEDASSRRTRG